MTTQSVAAGKKGLIRRFLPYYRKYWKTVVFDLCCAALTSGAELALPMIVREITGRATTPERVDSLTTQFILTLGAVYLLLRIVEAAANYYMQYPDDRFPRNRNGYGAGLLQYVQGRQQH